MGELVTQAEAARRLGVAESSVSRYRRNHPELVRADGLVDLDAYREHQARNSATGQGRVDAKERGLAATAALRELELRERRGELKPAALVERLVLEAVAELWAEVERRLGEALTAAGVTEVEAAETAVEEVLHRARAAFATRMREVGARHDGDGDAGD